MKNISMIRYGETGYISILSQNDVFINSPGNPSWLMKKASDVLPQAYGEIKDMDGELFESDFKGDGGYVTKVMNRYESPYSG